MRLICLLAAALCAAPALAHAQQWKNYPDLAAGVSVQFPAEPDMASGSYPIAKGSVPATIYSLQQGTSHYSLTIADFSNNSSDQGSAVRQAINAVHDRGEVKLDLNECISGQPGREFSLLGKDGSMSKFAIFSVGPRLYLLEVNVLPPNVQQQSAAAVRFQQSLSFSRGSLGRGAAANVKPACRGRAGAASTVPH